MGKYPDCLVRPDDKDQWILYVDHSYQEVIAFFCDKADAEAARKFFAGEMIGKRSTNGSFESSVIGSEPIPPANLAKESAYCCFLDANGKRCEQPPRFWVGSTWDDYVHSCGDHVADLKRDEDTVHRL